MDGYISDRYYTRAPGVANKECAIFQTFSGFGSEQTGSTDIRGAQHGDDLLLGDDELAPMDEPEG